MGEVHRGRDTRLSRTVAIKVLPAHVSQDPERKARFEREAKTVASLGVRLRPHEATGGQAQYDVTPDGQRFLLNRMLPDVSGGPLTVVVDWAAGLGQ